MTKDQVRQLLESNGYSINKEERTGNDLGTVYRLSNGCIVNCWDSGKVNCQGKNKAEVEQLLSRKQGDISNESNKKFLLSTDTITTLVHN